MNKSNDYTKIIKNLNEVPQVFLETYQLKKETDFHFPDCVYIPEAKWGEQKESSKLICDFDNKLLILEDKDEEVKATFFKHTNINYIQNGRVLLYSWVFISGVEKGKLKTFMVIFNSVDENKFIPLINSIRKKINHISDRDFDNDSKFEFLYPENLKFLSASYRSVVKGEKVLFAIYQESIFASYLKVIDQRIAPNHMIILCDKELIIISETMTERKETDCYSGVSTYINLKRIDDLKLTVNSSGDQVLIINMEGSDTVTTVYNNDKKGELTELIERVKTLV